MASPLAVCRHLSKTYVTPSGGIEALHSVDATFALGEITAVVGASGSGKSTLLRALAGLDRPTGGTLSIGGRELQSASPPELRRHRREVVTFVNQKPADNFVPHLTVREQGAGAEQLLEEFGVSHRLDARPTELSGGEQARAALALALARRTPLLVVDEPTAELDRGSAAPLLEALHAHAGAGIGFVVATHDADVVAIAHRVLRLDRGRVVSADGIAVPRAHAQAGVLGTTVLTARAVEKSFREGSESVHALRDATLELARGDVGVLLGRSGSGKSTLLTLLAGLLQADRGTIGYALSSEAPADLPWRELAFLPQRFGLLPELTVRENVEYPIRLSGTGGSASELLARLGLDELADRLPQETSIGQQQRTALARALVLAPDVLLADEPTSHQDAGWRDRVWEVLVEAAGAGTACLVATHEDAAAAFATRVWRIEGGVVDPVDG
jgi:putative ABC transport system ATP-binding protein